MRMIPYGKQSISAEDIRAVVNVLESDFITQGPVVPEFEQAVANYCGSRYGIAVNSATSALHIACRALKLGPGDYLWTTPVSFVASANCGLYCGSKVDFVDIDPKSYNMSIDLLEEKLLDARKNNKLPKIVVPVHFTGQSCEMQKIAELAKEFGFAVIEDAAHAIGGKYEEQQIGSCMYSDMTVFSFHPVKIITTGEGGMALTSRRDLYERLQLLRNHGITRDPLQMTGESHGPWYYQQIDLGYNFRMTDLQAALGLSQLTRIDDFINHRQVLARRYNDYFKDLPVTLPWQSPSSSSAWHLYVVRLRKMLAHCRAEIFQAMRSCGIGVNVHYIPIHLQPYYQKLGFKSGDFPNAEKYYSEAITLPLHHGMSPSDQDRVIDTFIEVISKYQTGL